MDTLHRLTVRTVTVEYSAPRKLRACVDGPEIARRVVAAEMQKRDTDAEHFFLLTLTARHVLQGFKILHTGTHNEISIDAAKLFRAVLACGARGFIVAHNHPSGHPEFSREDINLTLRLAAGAAILGLKFNDHILITPDGRTRSLRAARPDAFTGFSKLFEKGEAS